MFSVCHTLVRNRIFFAAVIYCTYAEMAFSKSLIIVHPTSFYDFSLEAKTEINKQAQNALVNDVKIYTLVDPPAFVDELALGWMQNYKDYLEGLDQTELVASNQGENNIILNDEEVELIGGYMNACWREALINLAISNFPRLNKMIIKIPLGAIYGRVDEDRDISDTKKFEEVYRQFFDKVIREINLRGNLSIKYDMQSVQNFITLQLNNGPV